MEKVVRTTGGVRCCIAWSDGCASQSHQVSDAGKAKQNKSDNKSIT